ncbi:MULTISPECIES: hypothetical protein [Amycolatopsis]|uniref:Uncharacterized protein n=1 Tax=Amycolatopsis rubida TaxID=112413 RepID=A0A1I5VB49_9PSEU|nr:MULTISPECIES: hypothetical protein [Amycolatopsis]OAP21135.1 hypothetical protein A4R44_08111 [Amycolatopsis sp. M39]SFQ04632.1 hypothetical protein SAMN05421854_108282 [Amycolatopsis rubida]
MNEIVLPTAAELEADLASVRSEKISTFQSPFAEGVAESSELCGC